MTLKALAEQRLAALGEDHLRAARWPARSVPPALVEDPLVEQGRAGSMSRSFHVPLARFLGLAAPEDLAGVLDDVTWGRCLLEVDPGPGGRPVLLASDDAVIDPGERRVVYRAAELREALRLPTEVLWEFHRMKRTFGGTLEAN